MLWPPGKSQRLKVSCYFGTYQNLLLLFKNILVAKYLRIRAQKKAAEKAREVDEVGDQRLTLKRQNSKRFGRSRSDVGEDSSQSLNRQTEKIISRRGKQSNRKGKRTLVKEEELIEEERPPFSTEWHSHSSSKKIQPRAVVIPYCRLKKDRFFDWPPDPTVSRATPVIFEQHVNEMESITESLREPPVEELPEAPQSTSLRRRQIEEQSIPTNIAF